MFKFTTPLQSKDSLRKNRGDATITLILAIVLVSGVFLTGGILPAMREDTLKKDTEAVVQGVRSEDSSGTSFIASSGTTNDAKKTLQMKQLILATVTPTPTGTPIPTPTRTPTPTPAGKVSATWSVNFLFLGCNVNGFPKGEISTKGTLSGYTKIVIENTSGELVEVVTADFNPTASKNTISLLNDIGFNSKKWKIELYSGGSKTNGIWSGGVVRSSYEGIPTGC